MVPILAADDFSALSILRIYKLSKMRRLEVMVHNQAIPTVKALVKTIGRDRFQSALGHKPQVVSRAMAEGVMPAHWYWGVRDLCNAVGVVTPEHLFKGYQDRIAPKPTKQYANLATKSQGEPAK